MIPYDFEPTSLSEALELQLQRLLENAWGAMRTTDPRLTPQDFLFALTAAVANVIVQHSPLSAEPAQEAAAFSRLLLTRLMRANRQRGVISLLRDLPNGDGPVGPEVA